MRIVLSALAIGLLALAFALHGPDASADEPQASSPRHLVLALLNPERFAVVDLRTGHVAQRRLPGGTLCYSQLLVVGDRIVFMGTGARARWAMSLPLSLGEAPRRIARADVLAPSATPGRLWVGTVRTRRDGFRSLREVTLDGQTTAVVQHVSPGTTLLGAVHDGLVFRRRRSLVVFDPATGRWSRTTPGAFVVAVGQQRLASCGANCPDLLVTDGQRGLVIHAPHASSFVPADGAFSPDGELIAVALTPWSRPRLALVDVARRESAVVPDVRLGQRAPLAWAPSGRELYFAAPRGRIFSFRPEATRAEPVGVRFGDPIMRLLVTD
jgi:hypothetical protein